MLGASSTVRAVTRSFRRKLSSSKVPFYGEPRKEDDLSNPAVRIQHFVQHSLTAILDPRQADSVAAVGELTGEHALKQLSNELQGSPVLKDRPIVSKQTIPYQKILDSAQNISSKDKITFGQAYGKFLLHHGFDPDGRSPILYIKDPDLAYILLRYRQCHDYWHVLTGLPPTVCGELALKYVELWQTRLPLTTLSVLGGRWSLTSQERQVLDEVYVPWAQRVGTATPYGTWMRLYYEQHWDTPLSELRRELKIEPVPEL